MAERIETLDLKSYLADRKRLVDRTLDELLPKP
jgi:hypothetical protein